LPENVLPVTLTWELQGFPILWLGPTSAPITVQYAGPAPFEVAGVSQVNLVVNEYASPMSLAVGTGQCWIYVVAE
jgi:hypothetical protein